MEGDQLGQTGILEEIAFPPIPEVLPAIAISPNPVFCTHPFSIFFYVSSRWCNERNVRDEDIRQCITTLACHREGDTSPAGRIDFCERCAGPATNPQRKPIVRIGVTGLRTVRNPVAVTMEPEVPPENAAAAPPTTPDVLCYVYDACKAGCTTSRLHLKARLVLVGVLPTAATRVVSEPFVIMARDKPRRTPRKLSGPMDEGIEAAAAISRQRQQLYLQQQQLQLQFQQQFAGMTPEMLAAIAASAPTTAAAAAGGEQQMQQLIPDLSALFLPQTQYQQTAPEPAPSAVQPMVSVRLNIAEDPSKKRQRPSSSGERPAGKKKQSQQQQSQNDRYSPITVAPPPPVAIGAEPQELPQLLSSQTPTSLQAEEVSSAPPSLPPVAPQQQEQQQQQQQELPPIQVLPPPPAAASQPQPEEQQQGKQEGASDTEILAQILSSQLSAVPQPQQPQSQPQGGGNLVLCSDCFDRYAKPPDSGALPPFVGTSPLGVPQFSVSGSAASEQPPLPPSPPPPLPPLPPQQP